ncbi:unnamed protein product [Penicillium salamii]|nr:unnamed protein product [Penicillium salamii]CAG8243487.1 unnamed protein product [Penicillium salamii]
MGDNIELELFRQQWREELMIESSPMNSPVAALASTAPPRTKNKMPLTTWSMYQDLHDEVSPLLVEADLHFGFYEDDDDTKCTRMRDTNIMGRFVCNNRACKYKGWSSKMIAITIRLYPEQKYNARVYHQRCKGCSSLSRPVLDHSYAERVIYWIMKWNGIRVERTPSSRDSRGPHNCQLCEGCRAGHCSQSGEDWVTRLGRLVSINPTHLVGSLTDAQVDYLTS